MYPVFLPAMDITGVLNDQRQELERSMRELSLVAREAEQSIQIRSQLIRVVSGVRRCGKSVLVYKLLKGKEFGYVNFDDDRLLDAEPDSILSAIYQVYGQQLKTLFLDEIQNLAHWELFVNRLHRAGFQIFLTGSNAKLLAREMATHLTGRHLTQELFPFSFREFLHSKNFQEDTSTTRGKSLMLLHLQKYLQEGGFPEIALGREEPLPYLRELYRRIVERDIVSRYNLTYKKTLKEIAQTILSNPGRQVSYGKLRRQFAVGSDHTVKNYISYLEEAYLVLFLSGFSFKPVEIEKSGKKAYGIDTGMITAVSVQPGKELGRIYETAVALELFRQQAAFPAMCMEVYYWKNKEQEEVDFLVREGRQITELIQVCYDIGNEMTKSRELRVLLKAGEELRCQNLLVITEDKEGEENAEWFGRKGKIRFLPLWKWLLRTRTQPG